MKHVLFNNLDKNFIVKPFASVATGFCMLSIHSAYQQSHLEMFFFLSGFAVAVTSAPNVAQVTHASQSSSTPTAMTGGFAMGGIGKPSGFTLGSTTAVPSTAVLPTASVLPATSSTVGPSAIPSFLPGNTTSSTLTLGSVQSTTAGAPVTSGGGFMLGATTKPGFDFGISKTTGGATTATTSGFTLPGS